MGWVWGVADPTVGWQLYFLELVERALFNLLGAEE